MAVSAGAVAFASKAAMTWLGAELGQWIKDRKASAAEQRTWTEISNKVLKQTKATAERYAKITTVAFPRDSVRLDEIYVPLTVQGPAGELRTTINKFPSDLLRDHRKVLIVDVAGMGKSTVSKIVYLQSLEEKRHLPVLIDLRRLDGSQDIESCLAKQFGLKQKHEEVFAEFLASQPLLFIFDGFDEVSDAKKLEVARTVRHFVDRSERGTFIMTSRPELPFNDYADFTSLRIKELTKDEAFSLVRNYGRAYGISDRAKSLIEELQAKHDAPVESFLKNPLLTSLLFRAFEYKSVIPVKRGVFYRQVFDALYEAHDLSKETGYVRDKRTGLHHDDFHRTVRAMAKLFREQRVVEVSTEKFLEMARQVSRGLCPDLAFPPEALLHDLLHTVPLFLKDGNLVRWAHKSLLDYFLCEFLLRDFAESKEEALRLSSSGLKARANENFLVLVHEADPILFAKSVTLPAIDRLLARHAKISANIPKGTPNDVANDIAAFFMCHEVVTSPNEDAGVQSWINSEPNPPLDVDSFVPQALYNFGGTLGSIGVYTHEAAVALHVPMMAGNIPHIRGHSIARNYPKASPEIEFQAPKKPMGFISARNSARAWQTAEDDFTTLMGFLSKTELRFPTKEMLETSKQELQALVSTSIAARSNDIF